MFYFLDIRCPPSVFNSIIQYTLFTSNYFVYFYQKIDIFPCIARQYMLSVCCVSSPVCRNVALTQLVYTRRTSTAVQRRMREVLQKYSRRIQLFEMQLNANVYETNVFMPLHVRFISTVSYTHLDVYKRQGIINRQKNFIPH